MTVRGAPAIAIVAALSLAVELAALNQADFADQNDAANFIIAKLKYLEGSRPTAVNLFEASSKLQTAATIAAAHTSRVDAVLESYIATAEAMLEADVAD